MFCVLVSQVKEIMSQVEKVQQETAGGIVPEGQEQGEHGGTEGMYGDKYA